MASSNCCDYNGGMLRHTIDIQYRNLNPDDEGGGSPTDWETYASSVRAYIKPVSGHEQLHAMQLEGVTTHMIVIRYRAGITVDMRVKFGTRYFGITKVINVEERNRWLVLDGQEGPPQ